MNLVFTLFTAILSGAIGYFVIRRNSRSATHIAFAVFCASLASWSIANYFSITAQSTPAILFWMRAVMAIAVLQSVSFFFFIQSFPSTKLSLRKRFAVGLPIIGFITILIAFSPFLFSGVTFSASGERSPVVAPGMLLFLITAVGSLLTAFIQLFRKSRRSDGKTRLQLRFILIGTFVMFFFILLFNFVLVVAFKNSLFVNLAPVFVLPFVFAVFYSMTRHRLMDVRLAMQKTFVKVATNTSVLIFILVLIFAVARALGQPIGDLTLVFVGGIALFIGLFFFTPLNHLYERIANKYFFTSLYNYQTTLEELARQLTSVIDLHKVIDLIVDSIMKTMGLDRAGVLLLSGEKNSKHYSVAKVIGFNEQNGISLVRNNFLIQWLEENRKLVVWEELGWLIEETNNADDRSQLMRLKTNMSKIEASVCLPLFSKDVLIGIIVLGNKITGEAYTTEDLRLLQSISNQAAVAVQNARLYDQVQDFNRNLEQKVQEQTKDIAEKSEHLQELIKMRSEFLSIASHQLRTPLTAIRGLLAMQADGDFDKLSKTEVKDEQKHMLDSANRLSNIVNDLLKAMELEGGSLNFEFQQVQLEEMLDSVCSDLKPNYDHKELYLKFDHPKSPLPKIEAEPKMLHEVLMNIIDNAEKYTNKGGTTISLSTKDDYVTLTLKDTGIGIPQTDRPKLFQKFSRGEKSSYQHTNGSGLGLFITKNVIDEHHGTVDITSAGEGKGSTVTITLPIHQPNHSTK